MGMPLMDAKEPSSLNPELSILKFISSLFVCVFACDIWDEPRALTLELHPQCFVLIFSESH